MANPVHRLLRFGVFEMNLDTQELRSAGTLVRLPPQPFKLLGMLASHSGQIISRDEIKNELWGEDTFVDFERGVHKCVNQIRQVLNDKSERPLYIETLPRKGYRFLAPVTFKTVIVTRKVSVSGPMGPETAELYARSGVDLHDAPAAAGSAAVAVDSPTPEAGVLPASTTNQNRSEPKPFTKQARVPEIGVLLAELRSPARRTRLLLAGLVLGVMAGSIAGARYLYSRLHPPVLTDKDTIVLADFDNKTGDSVFDGTLRQGLWSALEQSPFLNILSDGRIAQTMALMTQAKGAALTPELARQVCIRTGSAATLEGAIASFGSQYVVTLKAVNCSTGEEIAVEQATAASKEKIVRALGSAASKMRAKLGESLTSVQKYDAPLEDVTTPSLEALQAYSRARKAASTYGPVAALPFYNQALELDPNFALGYVSLATEYANLNQPGRSAENARKAYDLRSKVSEKERLYIEAYYHLDATGDLEKAVQVYEQWQQAFPRNYVPYGNLSLIYMELGDWEKSLTHARAAIQLVPNNNIGWVNAGGAYLGLDRLEDAEQTFRQVEERGLWSEDFLVERYQLAFLRDDTARIAQLLASAAGHPGAENVLLATQADTDAWFGNLQSARRYTQRAMDSAERSDAKEGAASYQAVAALREAEFGNSKRGKELADAAVQLAANRNVQSMAAVALARAHDTAGAERLAAALDNQFPSDTLVQKYWLPTIRAALSLQRHEPAKAIEALEVTRAIELSQPDPAKVSSFLYPIYLRGEAYLMLHDGKSAAAEFQKFIDHRGVVGNNPMGALARLGLARAYADQGDTAKARQAYQAFLNLWKAANADIPVYEQAKGEYRPLMNAGP